MNDSNPNFNNNQITYYFRLIILVQKLKLLFLKKYLP